MQRDKPQPTGRRDRITFADFVLDDYRDAVWVTVDENAEWLFLDKGDSQIMMSISCAEHVVELLRRALEAARAKRLAEAPAGRQAGAEEITPGVVEAAHRILSESAIVEWLLKYTEPWG